VHFPGTIARASVNFRFGSISLAVSLASVPNQYAVRSRKLEKSLAMLYLPFVGGYAFFTWIGIVICFFLVSPSEQKNTSLHLHHILPEKCS